MKLKFTLSLLMLFFLMKANARTFIVNDITSTNIVVSMHSNGIPFDVLTGGKNEDNRSAFPLVPIDVLLNECNHSIELGFLKAVGEIEITVSLNGAVIYSSSERVQTVRTIFVNLLPNISGDFLIEIKGKNGACIYGRFSL